jgi:glycogen operon protein
MCLFDGAGRETRLPLTDATFGIWHGYLPDVHPGQLYGLRVDGPYDPARGQLHNPTKLLVDPYAKAIIGDFSDHPAVYAATRVRLGRRPAPGRALGRHGDL